MPNQIKKLPYEDYKFIYERVPRLCVDLAIKTDAGILLSKRDINPGKGMWHMPGGTILKGESLLDTLSRVAEEEAGIVIKNPKLLGAMEFSNHDNLYFHTISLVHLVTEFEGEIRGSEQGEEIRFHSFFPEKLIEEQREFLSQHKLL